MTALAATAHGLVELDVDEELVLELDVDGHSSRVHCLQSRCRCSSMQTRSARVSSPSSTGGRRSRSRTTRVRRGARQAAACPPGRAVAIHPDDPDLVLFAARNRLYLSRDGGRFWAALAPELPEIAAVAWAT